MNPESSAPLSVPGHRLKHALNRYLTICFLNIIGILGAAAVSGIQCSDPDNDIRIQSAVSTTLIHNHQTDITFRLLAAGVRRFNLLPAGGHDHNFQINEEQYALLQLGLPVVVQSSINQAHEHTVTIQRLE